MKTEQSICTQLLAIYEAADVFDPISLVDSVGLGALRIPDQWWNNPTFRTNGGRTNIDAVLLLAHIVRRFIEINLLFEVERPLHLSFHRIREDIGFTKSKTETALSFLLERGLLVQVPIEAGLGVVPATASIAQITLRPEQYEFFKTYQNLLAS